jgi:hypothetical protein
MNVISPINTASPRTPKQRHDYRVALQGHPAHVKFHFMLDGSIPAGDNRPTNRFQP